MNKQKVARDSKKGQNRYLLTEESNGLSEIEYPNLKTNSCVKSANLENEKKETIQKTRNEIILPIISTNNSIKIEENISNIKDNLNNDEDNKLNEINNMMKKVIEEN